eukprot:TRINITY_DN19087_c0_g1_i1.p3 TRINITY_DN19087_c0_g1~~TRINITY_DN19087_c0_g1_i1.p3  ORF type:complete len:314 (+),score=-12.49 TRINITY_DN19087_c0_g1_i1:912-1853(+)
MRQILDTDLDVGHGAGSDQFLVHVSLECQALHVGVMAERDEPFAPHVRSVIRILHRLQHPEHGLVLFHEKLARQLQVLDPARSQCRRACGGRHTACDHRIVDALTRGRCDDARRIACQYNVPAIVPFVQRVQRDRRALTAQRFAIGQAAGGAQIGGGFLEIHIRQAGAHPDAGAVTMGKDPAIEIRGDGAIIDHVTADRVVDVILGWGLDDLVICQHIWDLVPSRDFGLAHARPCAIGTDDQPAQQFLFRARRFFSKNHARSATLTVNPQESAHMIFSARIDGAAAQERIEILAIHHADKAVFDGNIDHASGR